MRMSVIFSFNEVTFIKAKITQSFPTYFICFIIQYCFCMYLIFSFEVSAIYQLL